MQLGRFRCCRSPRFSPEYPARTNKFLAGFESYVYQAAVLGGDCGTVRLITTHAVSPQRYRSLCRAGLAAVLFLAALLNGSVSPPYSQIAGCLAALFALLCLPVGITSSALRRLVMGTALILTLAFLWTVFQIVPLPLGYGHPIWQEVSALLPVTSGYLSVSPNRTLAALPSLVLPGLVFICTVLLCQSAHSARRVWHLLALTGAAIVLLSITLEAFFPDAQFFSTFQVGYGSFSGVFVNRNVSASYFGLTAFALAGSALIHAADGRQRKPEFPFRPALQPALVWLMLFATLIAIIATRSRAGTMLSLPLLFLCLGIIFAKARHHRRTARMLAVLSGGFVLLVLFGEPVFSRLDGAPQDLRWCAWASTIQGISDHPWAGTGFATFIEAFPAYRDPECLGTQGTWHRAHNSFLELAFGIGLPAAALLLGLSYQLLLQACFTGLRRRKSLRAIPVLTLGALGFVSAHSLADFPLQIPGVAYYFAALMGAGCAISTLERRAGRGRSRNPAILKTRQAE